MTPQITAVLVILVLAIILFISDKLRFDLVALLVLITLVLTNLVTPAEALSGFSSPAVITVAAVFALSGGLARTGVADILGRQVLHLSGKSEARLIIIIMLIAGTMSAFMNNVGAVALLLPVILIISRKTAIQPSKLLIPLSFACLLGGLTTLIGTSPNILAGEIVREAGQPPLRFFDFLPVGIMVMLSGIAFMVFVGRHMLPTRNPVQALSGQNTDTVETTAQYELEERLALIEIPPESPLVGKTLAESRLGQALGLTILGLQRHGRKQMTIQPDTILRGGDNLLTLGRIDRLAGLTRSPFLIIESQEVHTEQLTSSEIGFAELKIKPDSSFIGQTIAALDIRKQYGFFVIAIRRQNQIYRTHLQELKLQEDDDLLLLGDRASMTGLRLEPAFHGGLNIFVQDEPTAVAYGLPERMMVVRIPPNSPLVGQSLAESHLGQIYGLEALGIIRHEQTKLMPKPDSSLQVDDVLLVEGDPTELEFVRGLQGLQIKRQLQMDQVELESDSVGLVEAVLSPYTTLVNKTLRDIHFREKIGLSVLAIWRNGRAYRSDLGDMHLQFGDAFLLYGPRQKIKLLSTDSDFIVLHEEAIEAPNRDKAWLAALIMLGVIVTAMAGWLPIALAALIGATLMVLTRCIDMEEAYRAIEWPAVIMIACLLSLGISLENSGTASFLAEQMFSLVGGLGDLGILAGFFVMTAVAVQFIPGVVVILFMAPIALNIAAEQGISATALMMVVAIATSASFMSPIGHPVNVLVMGPGGYRFSDYTKVGIPLTLVVFAVTMLVLPLVWPLR